MCVAVMAEALDDTCAYGMKPHNCTSVIGEPLWALSVYTCHRWVDCVWVSYVMVVQMVCVACILGGPSGVLLVQI